MSTLAPKVVTLATFVAKIEDAEVHVADVLVGTSSLNTRIAVRGGKPAVDIVAGLADSVTVEGRGTGLIESPLWETMVSYDGVGIVVVGV